MLYIISIICNSMRYGVFTTALQVHPKSAKPERLQGLENRTGEVRQKWKIEHCQTLYEIVRKSGVNFEKIIFRFFVWEMHIDGGIEKVSNKIF